MFKALAIIGFVTFYSEDASAAPSSFVLRECIKAGWCEWFLWLLIIGGIGFIALGYSTSFRKLMNTGEDGEYDPDSEVNTTPTFYWVLGGGVALLGAFLLFGN